MKKLILIVFACALALPSFSQIAGKWKTIDDKSGKVRSIVEITEIGGKVFGKIVQIFPEPNQDPDPICNKCAEDDPRHKSKIIGMEIIRNLTRQGESWEGGDILDPENGQVYKTKLWIEGKVLKVRGYWGPFFRTQTWHRAE